MSEAVGHGDLGVVQRATDVATTIAAPAAFAVDRDSRFPAEAIDGLRSAGLLALPVPRSLGGPGASLAEILDVIRVLARADASLGLILTMHYSQLAVIGRHGQTPQLHDFLASAAREQLLVANCNSEKSIAGTDRRSLCALLDNEAAGAEAAGGHRLAKETPVISYGEYADAVLVTARRGPDAAPNDQVLALVHQADLDLVPLGDWDALGLRGSCSRPFSLTAAVGPGMVIENYREVIDATGLPLTNAMFGAAWVGMAEQVLATARLFTRKKHRGSTLVDLDIRRQLAEMMVSLDSLRGLLAAALARFEVLDGTEEVSSLAFVSQLQTLKVAGTRAVVAIARAGVELCGAEGYRNDGPYGLGRSVRDALGSMVMVSNDAILGQNGEWALLRKEL